MPSVGPLSPSTGTSSGSPAWTNPERITASDDSRSLNVNFAAGTTTGALRSSDYNPAVPSGATIDGIVLEAKRSGDFETIVDSSVRLTAGGVAVGDNKADTVTFWPITTSETHVSYGGPADTWGRAWTDSEINGSGFGAAVVALNTHATNARTARFDHMRITVYYTEGGGGPATVEGAAALTATTALTAAGIATTAGNTSLDATGTLTATGAVTVLGSAAFSTIADLVAAGQIIGQVIEGSADLNISVDLDASGIATVIGQAAFSAAFALAASGQVEGQAITGAAVLSATADLAVSGVVTAIGQAAFSASGSLTADGLVIVQGAVTLVLTSALSASGQIQEQEPEQAVEGAATLVIGADLSASGLVIVSGAVVFDATTILIAMLLRPEFITPTPTVAALLNDGRTKAALANSGRTKAEYNGD